MSLDYLITPEGRDDIEDAHAWYEAQSVGRGDAFYTEVAEMVARLRDAPESFEVVRGTTRAAPLPVSKYIVYYRVDPDRIRIIAVQHAAADPKKWHRRK